MTIMKKTIPILLGLALASTLSAQIIYNETFSGGATSIDRVAPDIAPGAETWFASDPGINADGSFPTNTEGFSAFLPTSSIFQANTSYEVTLDLNFTFDETGGEFPPWFGLAFWEGDEMSLRADRASSALGARSADWFLLRSNGAIRAFEGLRLDNELVDSNDPGPHFVNNGGNAFVAASEFTGGISMRTTLDVGATLDDTELNMFVNDLQLDLNPGNVTIASITTDVSNYEFVGISLPDSLPTSNSFAEFTVTQIPERSTSAALVGGLALALATLRRRR